MKKPLSKMVCVKAFSVKPINSLTALKFKSVVMPKHWEYAVNVECSRPYVEKSNL